MRQGRLGRLCANPWLAAAVLCVLTVGTLQSGLRYQPAPGGPIAGRSLEARPDAWHRTSTGVEFLTEQGRATARIAAVRDGRIAALWVRLALPAGLDAVRIELDLRANGIARGGRSWQTGRVQMLGYDRSGRYLWYWPREVAELSGNSDWRSVDAIFPVAPELAFADLVVFNGAESGEVGVRAARLTGLVERPTVGALRHGLLAAWVVAGLWAAVFLVRRSPRPAGAAALVGCAGLALAAALTPQPAFQRTVAPLESSALAVLAAIDQAAPPPPAPVVRDASEDGAPDGADGAAKPAGPPQAAEPAGPAPDATHAQVARPSVSGAGGAAGAGPASRAAAATRDYPFNLKQAGHFVTFLVLGLAAHFAFPGVPAVRRLGALMVFAVATETLQLFVITRSGSATDLAIDAAGLLCAAGLPGLARAVRALARAWSRRLARFAARP